jgi:hypothetical protein
MNVEQLQQLNADYKEVYGGEARYFFCPILLVDEKTELCDGHVLCKQIKGVSRAKVIQRSDVDNHFGSMIEPDPITFLNMAVDSPAELINRPKTKLSIKMSDGSETEAFFANAKAGKRFQRVGLKDRDGKPVASPYLRDGRLTENLKDMEVSWTIVIRNSAVLGSLLKSGYLAMFRLLNYRWANSLGGDRVRRALKAFYDAKSEGTEAAKLATKVFADFEGCVTLMRASAVPAWKDTVEGNTLLLHNVERRGASMLFGISCLFRVNSQLFVVTMPTTERDRDYFTAYSYYRNYLKNRAMKQVVQYAIFEDNTFKVDQRALNLIYQDKPDKDSPA